MDDNDFLPDTLPIKDEAQQKDAKPMGKAQPKKAPNPEPDFLPIPVNKSFAKKGTKVATLLAQKLLDPLATNARLAEINGITKQSVASMLGRYGINSNYLESFKKHRADIFSGIQETVAASLSEEDIRSASVRERTVLLGVLYDKERLERGQSTSNQSVFFHLVAESDKVGEPNDPST